MQQNAEFVKITHAGYTESQPHDVDVMEGYILLD
jgi:IMP dehydrogenase/GMP reductase